MSLSLPRPILFALVGLVAISAAFVATRGKKDTTPAPSSSSTATLAAPSELGSKSKRQPAAKKAEKSARGVNTPAKPAKKVDAASVTGLPRRVAHAIAKKRVVVLFFSQRGPADDTATRASVRALRSRHGKVSVFTDRIRNLSRYHRLVGELGVAGAPAVVIVGRDLKARLIEGFVDKDSLLQQVKDARR